MDNKKLISIQGLPGSGKSVVIDYLQKKFSWPKVYFGKPTFDELEKLGLPVTEKNERMVREKFRKDIGAHVYALKSVPYIEKLLPDNDIILLESLYSWAEYLHIKEKYGNAYIVIAVYAPPQTRYERLKNRKERALTKEESKSRDYAQIEFSRQAGPIAMADYTLINDSTLDNLHIQIDKIINNIANLH